MPTAPTAIIADDERLMRDQLRLRLSEAWPELEIIGEAKTARRRWNWSTSSGPT